MSIHTYEIPQELFLFTDVEDLQWSSQTLTVHSTDLGLSKVCVELHTNLTGWSALKKNGLFAYTPEICGPVLGGGFNPVKPFFITIELHSHHSTFLGILYDGENIEEWFLHETTQEAFRDSENFLLISTMQPFTPQTLWGMSTIYSQSHHQ